MISFRYRALILFFENNSNLDVMSSVIRLSMDEMFWQEFTGIIKSGIVRINSHLLNITLFLNITKPYWRQSTCRRFLIKRGIFLNISLWLYFPSSFCLIGVKPRQECNLYIIPEHYRTIGRARFYLSTAHTCQHCTTCNNKYAVPKFPRWSIIASLYYSPISDT